MNKYITQLIQEWDVIDYNIDIENIESYIFNMEVGHNEKEGLDDNLYINIANTIY